MERSNLIPFVRDNLDILFIGLNPALGSSRNKHYFSVNQSFWNQLYFSGLVSEYVDKSNADELIFGSNTLNLNNYNYGVVDLVTLVAESDSSKIKPTKDDCKYIINLIVKFNPLISIILHGKVLKYLFNYLNLTVPNVNSGYLGKIIPNSNILFYSIAFPHGNTFTSDEKIKRYIEVKNKLLELRENK